MASVIKLKRRTSDATAPTTSDFVNYNNRVQVQTVELSNTPSRELTTTAVTSTGGQTSGGGSY